jgi:hypothetical protein
VAEMRDAIEIANAVCSILAPFKPLGESSMRKELALFSAIVALMTLVAFSAQAMPAASLKSASSSGQTIRRN